MILTPTELTALLDHARAEGHENGTGCLESVQGERDAAHVRIKQLDADIAELRAGLDTSKGASVAGVSHALLNDLAALSSLPGSPTIADCIKQIMRELPKLRQDVAHLEAGWQLQAHGDAGRQVVLARENERLQAENDAFRTEALDLRDQLADAHRDLQAERQIREAREAQRKKA